VQAFDRFLRKAEAGLRVPEPRRSRILLEMASDLEDLYQEYRARGLGEEEARERAIRLLGASPEVLAELGREYGSRVAGLLDRLAGAGAPRLERVLLVLTAGLAVLGGAVGVTASGTVGGSPWSWGLLALLGAGAWTIASRAIALFVRPEGLGARPTEDLMGLLGLAAGCLTVSALGTLATLSVVAHAIVYESAPPTYVWTQVASVAGLSALGLTAALLLSGAWLLLRRRARTIEDAREALRSVLSPTLAASDASRSSVDVHVPSKEDIR
jgi:hypothetical protein